MATILLTLWLAAAAAIGGALPPDEARRRALEHTRMGDALLRSERYEEAAREFRTAVELDPLLLIAHYNLGQSYMALKQYPEAVRAYGDCQEAVAQLNTVGQREREQRDRATLDEINELKTSLVQLRTGKIKYVSSNNLIVRIEDRIRVLETARFAGREVLRVPAEVHLGLRQRLLPPESLPGGGARVYGGRAVRPPPGSRAQQPGRDLHAHRPPRRRPDGDRGRRKGRLRRRCPFQGRPGGAGSGRSTGSPELTAVR